jgi:NAD(P)-dependent dehydrogenase (short-subunit alcohol dehydrogenase family)
MMAQLEDGMRLKNKVAIVTGASKGIGKAIALAYAKEGAAVVVASRSMDLLTAVEKQIKTEGGDAMALPLDVRNPDSVNVMIENTVKKFGRLDVLVNNAGVSMAHPSETLSEQDWKNALETDLYGVFYGCQAAARVMIPQGGGCIINVTSVYGIVAAPGRLAYCASKAAANMLTKVLAAEWAAKNIRVNAIAPGYTRTELVDDVIARGKISLEAIERRTPMGKIGEVEDMVGIAIYMAGDESSYMTGSVVNVDGGWVAYGYL